MSPLTYSNENEKKILSETVEIISFSLTSNNHVLEKSIASATIITEGGLLLTNDHVVTNEENDEPYESFSICGVTDEKEKPECVFTASLVAKNKELDIALLQIDSLDIYGDPIPKFPFLEYETGALPPVEEKITLTGFPGVGGETITVTEGQISGYDEKEGFKQIKTDAVISPGNSGGTAKDSAGNFIGVPSYLRSDFGTIGYIVPLAEILPWLKEHRNDLPQSDVFANELLKTFAKKIHDTDQNELFTSSHFPFYTVDIPKPWKTVFLNDSNLMIANTVKGREVQILFSSFQSSYLVTDEYLQFIIEKIEKNQHNFTNYNRKKSSFSGRDGYLISYDMEQDRNFYFIAPLEDMFFSYSYNIPLENIENTTEKIEEIFHSFQFLEKENPKKLSLQTYTQTHPNISISTFDPFFIVPAYDSRHETNIVSIDNPYSFEQNFTLSQEYFPKDYWELKREEIMEKDLKYIGSQILNQYDTVVLDGLSGYAYTTSYKGDDFHQTRKQTVVVLFQNQKRYFEFEYDDLEENYNENISVFRKTLETFTYAGEENEQTKGEYIIPMFSAVYEDIQYHLYEKEINALANKHIFQFDAQTFFPERNVSRMKAVEAIFEGKKFVEKGRNLSHTQEGIDFSTEANIFADVSGVKQNKILSYAVEKRFITNKLLFYPNRGITLAEALTILCRVYELPVWNPPYTEEIEWFVPYMYQGELLGVIPGNLKHNDALNRGEFAFLLYHFIRIVGERDDL
jgi:hypothetical protein